MSQEGRRRPAARSGGAASAASSTLEGTIEYVTFQAADSGYTVARLTPDGQSHLVTIVGNLLGASVGASFRLRGRWTTHAQYGRQFQVEDFEERMPATVEGIRKYLGSGLIKGIGPVTADRIVDHFGLRTLEVIDEQPELLHQVPGVGPVRVRKILRAWQEQKQIKEIMLFLQSHDVTTGLSVRIYKTYGDEALAILRHDPYQMARGVEAGGVFNVGFKVADRVARKLGLAADSPRRIEAGLLFVLGELSHQGHTFVPRPMLVARTVEALTVEDEPTIEPERVTAAIERLVAEQPNPALILEPLPWAALSASMRAKMSKAAEALVASNEGSPPAVSPQSSSPATAHDAIAATLLPGAMPTSEDDGTGVGHGVQEQVVTAVYLPPFYFAEKGIARRVQDLLRSPADRLPGAGDVDWPTQLRWLETMNPYPLAERQREAVRMALTSKVVVLTGGPGTGKTTTVRSLLQLLERLHPDPRILLAAPTGRAAKRLAETTGMEAKTIHRLLEFKPAGGRLFQRHEDHPLEADLVVIDEMSMIDTLLMNHLIKAISPGTHVLLVGDVDQLPSVGPGNVLRDLIASGQVSTVALDQIFRQDERSWIAVNASRINRGEMPELARDSRDFFLFREEEAEAAAERVVDVVAQRVPRRFGLDPVDDIQVLSPMHRGDAGVASLNERLRERLNPPSPNKPEVRWGGRSARLGDKVMQIRNNYDKDVFNGDLGRVVAIDPGEQIVTVRMDEREVDYEIHELDELVPAWAISTHKSQGAEYPCVVMALVPQHWMMLQRNLLYTGVTRARELCVLVGSKRAIGMAVRNDRVSERMTGLDRRLREARSG